MQCIVRNEFFLNALNEGCTRLALITNILNSYQIINLICCIPQQKQVLATEIFEKANHNIFQVYHENT